MSYTLQDFCAGSVLVAENNADGREVRQKLEQLLGNETFIEQFCGPDKPAGVYKPNEDPTTGAVVLSHVMGEGAMSPPHDHGTSWAVTPGQRNIQSCANGTVPTTSPMMRISRLRKIANTGWTARWGFSTWGHPFDRIPGQRAVRARNRCRSRWDRPQGL